MIGIYGIFRKSDDKCMYVGQSKNIAERIRHHKMGVTYIKVNTTDFYYKVLEEHNIDDKQYRLEREAYWINELDAELNVIRDNHFPEESKKKMSESRKGKPSGMKGKHPSEETRNKNRLAILDRKWINNGVITKLVKQNELHHYLNNGWVLGRIKPIK